MSEKPLEPWQGDVTTEDSLTLGDESSVRETRVILSMLCKNYLCRCKFTYLFTFFYILFIYLFYFLLSLTPCNHYKHIYYPLFFFCLCPQNGWDVDDMFRKNEEKYGVTTSYTPDMVGYTTPLNRRNTREYREREARATIIAEEIMSSPGARMRAEMENGDEEDKYVI